MVSLELMKAPHPNPPVKSEPEQEHEGPIWKHPYFAYILLTLILFLFLLVIGWLALDQGWIPSRGI